MTTVQELEAYINTIIDKKEMVLGEIYMIRNKNTGMAYIGQTLTHRLNHGRYRPFGYERRFKSHISEALCNTKETQCRYMSSSIRVDGQDAFEVSLLCRCLQSQSDDREMELIQQHNTVYPNGYNLAIGGRFKTSVVKQKDLSIPDADTTHTPVARNTKKTEETKSRISESLKTFVEENREKISEKTSMNATKQHNDKKLQHFRNENFVLPQDADIENMVKFKGSYCYAIVSGKKVTFTSVKETREQSKERAIEFLRTLQTPGY